MLAPRSPRYPMLTAYLASRTLMPPVVLGSPRIQSWALSAATTFSGLAVVGSGTHLYTGSLLLAVGGALAFVGFRTKPPPPPTPEQELARRADEVAKQLREQGARLHRALHPAVGATLEECATYLARIAAALEGPGWHDATPQWAGLRNEAQAAAKVAMDEALLHAGPTLAFVPPARPLEQVSDVLEDIGLGPLMRDGRAADPLPPGFAQVRELAERLRELAGRCETAATQRRTESSEPVSMAFRRLDAALGEMRQIEEAEGELRQGA